MPLAEQTRQAEILATEAEYYQAEREVIAAAKALITETNPSGGSTSDLLRAAVNKLNAMEDAAARKIAADRKLQESA